MESSIEWDESFPWWTVTAPGETGDAPSDLPLGNQGCDVPARLDPGMSSNEVTAAELASTVFAVSTECQSLQPNSPQTVRAVDSIHFAKGYVQSPIPVLSEARTSMGMSTPLPRGEFPFDAGGNRQQVRTESMAELPIWKSIGMKANESSTPCSEFDSGDHHDSTIPTRFVPFWEPEVPSNLMEQLLLQMR